MKEDSDTSGRGLTTEEVLARAVQSGPNLIFRPSKTSFWGIARHEVTEPMILLLLVVGVFYSIWGKLPDAITIFVVICLLVLAEVYNEFRAKKAIDALGKIASPKTKVLRNGRIEEIDSEAVVPDDLLVLTTGTRIAADAGVMSSAGLQVDESVLTGESFPVDKDPGSEVYAGTVVTAGEGEAGVIAIGKNTKLGKISTALKEARAPRTALQLSMKSLAGKLVYLAVFFSVFIPVIGILQGRDIKVMVLTGLSLSFATIPEELPIIITMVLGLGAFTLSKHNFLVKRLKAAETLGNATVIVSDKTGTITENQMRIASLYPDNEREIIKKAYCSISRYSFSPIEQVIRGKAAELNIEKACPEAVHQRDFGNGRKTKSIIRKNDGGYELFTIGAPEEIFACCGGVSAAATQEFSDQTSKGRRVIAVAYKEITAGDAGLDFAHLEREMDFAGLISLEDPPKEGVRETILKASGAGIRTIMVTGDHPSTALYIARKVGISDGADRVLTGADIDDLPDEDLQNAVKTVSIFARTTPEHKYRIVRALQKNGEVVAVTGDGINDALALKTADIGLAMGIKGTDVAKEAAEVVLADDNFITITRGIYEGRKFFDNLQKGIKYYLSVKVALILIFLLPALLGVPMPLAPIQIILLELFMDLAASAGFVAEPAEKDIYSRPPRNPRENILNGRVITDIFVKGAFLFITVTSAYFYARSRNEGLAYAQTYAFSAWIFAHILLAFISRSDKESVFSMGFFRNRIIDLWAAGAIGFLVLGLYVPGLQERINLVPISPGHLILIAAAVFLIISTVELKKVFNLHKNSGNT